MLRMRQGIFPLTLQDSIIAFLINQMPRFSRLVSVSFGVFVALSSYARSIADSRQICRFLLHKSEFASNEKKRKRKIICSKNILAFLKK